MMRKVKEAIVVGASSGIGLSTAKLLVASGARVTGIGRTEATQVANVDFHSLLRSTEFSYKAIDMTLAESISQLNKIVESRLDFLVVSAGSGAPSSSSLPIALSSAIHQNVIPILNSWEACRDSLSEYKGSAVFVSSIAGSEDIDAPIEYAMAKASIPVLGKLLARRFPEFRVNVVSPGNVLTDGSVWKVRVNEDPERLKKYLEESVPQARLGNPDEIARVIFFLLSAEASFVTGETIRVDGGQTRGFN